MSSIRIQQRLQQATAQAMSELYSATLVADDIQVQETREEFVGDFTIVVFPLARMSKKNPQQTAEELGRWLEQNVDEIQSFEIVKGFLNILLADRFWLAYLDDLNKSGDDEWAPSEDPKTIMVEYSSPNTNKPLHLGHVRNNLLGYAVSNILKARGHKVIMANLCNDRGIHICKSMLGWQKWGNGVTPEQSGEKGDHLVGHFYVLFQTKLKEQIQELKAQGISEDDAEKQAPLMQEAQEMLRNWEAGDEKTVALWRMMNSWVYAGFEETYYKLGVHFDRMYYESQTYLLGKDIVLEGLSEGVFNRRDDGSVWIDLTDEGLDQKLVLRSDGTSVYITQDMGTAQNRFDELHLDRTIYVVGNEQDYHFKVLKLIFKKFGRKWWDQIYHLSYGMVELPTGKMKTREGTVVDADDLIEGMIEESRAMTLELGRVDEMEAGELDELVRKVALAALKFFILKVDPKKSMLFDPKESIDLHGFTGPYIQYVYARVRSILRKAGELQFGPVGEMPQALVKEERDLLFQMYKSNVVIEAAENDLSPALLANYAYELARTFNRFYDACRVVQESDAVVRHFRLLLAHKTAETLRRTCALLGIEMPEKM